MRYCKKCNNELPWSMVIAGKKRSLKNRVFCLQCSPFKEHNTRDLTKVNPRSLDIYSKDGSAMTRECKHHGVTEFAREGTGKYRCKRCRSESVMRSRNNKKST